ncbi:hypothetical protein GCM10023349_18460 [Nocardioides conyzicola]|uniref:Endonuclease/exonuclease/phosphatase domain-containing protein n=1 Tax=Nocardioides conyzicola TaxID=1651781 RepID=A0ABP8X9F9_9ACTN
MLGVLVAPAVADDAPRSTAVPHAAAPVAGVTTTPRSVEPRIVRPVKLARGGQAAGTVAPVERAIDVVGVASMNVLHSQSASGASADVLRLVGRPGLDVVGWQEAQHVGGMLHELPGWTTATFPEKGGFSELAVSWRTSTFKFVRAELVDAISGVDTGDYPFGSRQIAVVTLEHRASGGRLTVLDAHLPPMIEDPDRPGRWTATVNAEQARTQLGDLVDAWRSAGTRWVVGTGDFNFDARADLKHHPAGGPARTVGRVARSTYQLLGAAPRSTYPSQKRSIDYVWVDRHALSVGRIDALGQQVLTGFHSDHRPLAARLQLN